jgi:hypothetical protein
LEGTVRENGLRRRRTDTALVKELASGDRRPGSDEFDLVVASPFRVVDLVLTSLSRGRFFTETRGLEAIPRLRRCGLRWRQPERFFATPQRAARKDGVAVVRGTGDVMDKAPRAQEADRGSYFGSCQSYEGADPGVAPRADSAELCCFGPNGRVDPIGVAAPAAVRAAF